MSYWNLAVFNFIHGWSGHSVVADVVAIFFAEYVPYLLVIGFLVLVFREFTTRRKFYLFAEGALAVILARGILAEGIYFFYHVPRPFTALGFSPLIGESGWSFPSGHMAWFFALAVTVWFADRKWGAWFIVLAALMGIARIYAGVHWPLDVVAGAATGIVSGCFVHWLLKNVRAAIMASPETEGAKALS
jgi:undecaprenyl-diphosphatase